ncbi:MAG: aspartyl-tRNA(Asn)/glutamyl-tRNA(Gln) amidotransferase subunit [Micromonosporaceae bacterium]
MTAASDVVELHELSVAEAGALVRTGRLTSLELTENAVDRIARLDPLLHSFVLVTADLARSRAEQADRELAAGHDRGPMHGIPYALKDIFATAGIPTTSNSRLMVDHRPEQDSAVEERLRDGGGVLLGKLATHEFALGGPSFELPFPPARNPWDLDRFPGASSSGSGAAVAAGLVRVAIGSDTSGSIRGPACHCGVVGLKPTFGLVSRRGAFPLSYSLDHVGPVARTVHDAALALQVIGGPDDRDPAGAGVDPGDVTSPLDAGVAYLRIAYGRDMIAGDPATSPEVLAAIDGAVEILRGLGARVEEVTLPPFELFNAVGRVIMAAEGYTIHERWLRDRPADYGRYTYQRLVPGAGLTAADLVQAQRVRRQLADTMSRDVLTDHCALILGSSLAPAARFADFPRDWPPPRAATATQTIVANVTGHPALGVPVGLSREGLPLGLQLIGRAFDEATVLRIGAALERCLTPTLRPPGY